MKTKHVHRGMLVNFVLIFFLSFFFVESCRNSSALSLKAGKADTIFNKLETESINSNINYRIFHNNDSTWGFTIFVDNHPFRRYSKIPVQKAKKGFVSRLEADKIANYFVKMIHDGNPSPELKQKDLTDFNITLIE